MMSKYTLRYKDNGKYHVAADGDYEIMIGIIRGHYTLPLMITTPDWKAVNWTLTRNHDNIIVAQSQHPDPEPPSAIQAELTPDGDMVLFKTQASKVFAMPRENIENLLCNECTTWEVDGLLTDVVFHVDNPNYDDGYHYAIENQSGKCIESGMISLEDFEVARNKIHSQDDPEPPSPTPVAKPFVPERKLEQRPVVAISPFVNKPELPFDTQLRDALSNTYTATFSNSFEALCFDLRRIAKCPEYSSAFQAYVMDFHNALLKTRYKSQERTDFVNIIYNLRKATCEHMQAVQTFLEKGLALQEFPGASPRAIAAPAKPSKAKPIGTCQMVVRDDKASQYNFPIMAIRKLSQTYYILRDMFGHEFGVKEADVRNVQLLCVFPQPRPVVLAEAA